MMFNDCSADVIIEIIGILFFLILDDDVPELCMSIKWVLCLNTFSNDVTEIWLQLNAVAAIETKLKIKSRLNLFDYAKEAVTWR